MILTNRGWIVLLLFLSVCVCIQPVSASGKQKADARPNVIVILVDDLGYGDLACYGAKDMRTPNIDALSKNGMRFVNAYANCPVCSPSRAALLSGRYPELVGVPGVIRTYRNNNWGYLDPQAILLPKMFKRAGYKTAMIGKWHLGLSSPNTPNERGFDHFHGFLGDMMDDYYHHRRHNNNYMRLNEKVIDPQGHATDLFSRWACDYLQNQSPKGQRDNKRPFFLYLAYNAPHTPIQPPREWLKQVTDRQVGINARRVKLVALIEHLDHGIGQVMKTLQSTGLDRNTLIVFTSDNGGQLSVGANNGPLRDGKGSVYEGGLKVPMIAVWPGKIRPGSLTQTVALSMDIFPTVCAAAEIKIDQTIDGRSVLASLKGNPQNDKPRDLFFTRREGGLRYGGKTIDALHRGEWKLLQNSPYQPPELYHLGDDPLEKNDLAASERKKYNELSAAMRAHLQRGGSIPWQRPVK